MTAAAEKTRFRQMVEFARPMVRDGDDRQKIQWEMLNHFDFLTNSDEHEEWTRNAIRECEEEYHEVH